MICKRFNLISISLLIIIQLGDINALTTRNKMRTLQNIMQMKSWKRDEKSNVNNLSQQEIFVKGQYGKLVNFTKNRPVVEMNEIDKISSAMYIALGCKCNESIKILLRKSVNAIHCVQQLKEINKITLNTISVLLNFIHVAPNVLSHEPGFLTNALSLNLQLNKLIFVEKDTGKMNSLYKKKILQMINSIEQYSNSNCTLLEMHTTVPFIKFASIAEYINDILNNVGLSPTYMLEFVPNNRLSNIYSFNVVNIQLVEKLKPLLLISDELEETIKTLNNIEDIVIYMNFINNSITKILYEIILQALDLFELYSKEGNEDHMQVLLDDWIKMDDIILQYEQIIEQSRIMKCTTHFITHIKILLKIKQDILVQNSILDLSIIKLQVNENLDALRNKKHPAKLLTMNNVSGYSFYEYLKKLLSIQELKTFNEILVLFHYNPAEYNSPAVTLNTIQFDMISSTICHKVFLFYNDCFNIQNKLMVYETSLLSMKEVCLSMLYKLKELINQHENELQNDKKLILKLAIGYLENNMINYPTSTVKLYMIINFIIIAIENFQIHHCEVPKFRGEAYLTFKLNLSKKNTVKSTNSVDMYRQKFENDKNTDEESIRLQIQNYVQELKKLSDLPSITFYYKGELRNMNEISEDLTNNVFDFSSFTKFYNIFHQWNLLLVFNVLDSILNYFLKEKYAEANENKLISYIKQIQSIKFPEYLQPSIKAIGNANNFSSPENAIGFLILMQRNIEQYSSGITLKNFSLGTIDDYFSNLNLIIKTLLNVYNEKPDLKTETKTLKRQGSAKVLGRLKSLS